MIPVIGIVVVLGCIAGGYLIEKGNLLVLMQPAELLIIGGAALGTVLIGNPIYVLKAILAGILQVFKGSRYTASTYLDTLKFLNDFFNTSRKNGLAALEQDLDEPDKSELFKRHPNFYKDKEALHFFCDTMRTQMTGGVDTHDLDQIMETDCLIRGVGHLAVRCVVGLQFARLITQHRLIPGTVEDLARDQIPVPIPFVAGIQN